MNDCNSRCWSLLSKTINWQFIFSAKCALSFHFMLLEFHWHFLFWSQLSLKFSGHILSFKLNGDGRRQCFALSHGKIFSLSLIYSMRQNAQITWKVHIFCSPPHIGMFFCSFFFTGNHCDSKEFQWKWYILTFRAHTGLSFQS